MGNRKEIQFYIRSSWLQGNHVEARRIVSSMKSCLVRLNRNMNSSPTSSAYNLAGKLKSLKASRDHLA
ncbi:hypothetical protein SUGI_0498420 [Cryptomeria japonica]|nr:hypothetical protein SUGI_0498420 [Cryptomeria japonica]